VGDDTWEERDWETNATILSGDLNGDDGPQFANNGENSYHVFFRFGGLDSTAVLDGFTVTGGNANGDFPHDRGGGMANYGVSATIANCTFSGNSAGSGGGIFFSNWSSPVLTNCTFVGNSAEYDGGGMYDVSGSPVLTNCTFQGNSAGYGGGGMHVYNGSLPVLTNCTFTGNSARDGGGMYNSTSSSPVLTNCIFSGNEAEYEGGAIFDGWESSPSLTNCTFSGNTAGGDGGAIANYATSNPVLANCILWADTTPEIYSYVSSEPVITYSDVQGGYEGEGNISTDPLFVDAVAGDLRLQLTSPAIDAGDSSAPGLMGITTDFGGNPRFAGVVDMGAYEAPPDLIFVDLEATGTSNGQSWTDALIDLQPALSWAVQGVEVWVAAGTYMPSREFAPGDPRSATFQMVNGVAIYGGFDPSFGDDTWEDRDWDAHPTILSGDIGVGGDPADNVYHVFYHPAGMGLDSSAILDGFTITASNADHPDEPHDGGGGMYNEGSSPALANCTFADNLAAFGGGMMNWSSSPPRRC
jgi:hypothetical protein